jgi:amidase
MNNFLVTRPEVPVHSIDKVCASGQVHPPNTFLPAIERQPLIAEDDPVKRRKLAARGTFQRAMLKAYIDSGLDGFVSPTVRIPPPSREDVLDSGSAWLPAVSMPAGFTDAGPLVGVEIIGKPFDEVTLLNIALAFEHGARARRVTDLSAAAR